MSMGSSQTATGDLIWEALLATSPASSAEIAEGTGLNQATVRKYLTRWNAEGRVERIRNGKSVVWKRAAPVPAGRQGPAASPTAALWAAMRVLREFGVTDLNLALQTGPVQPSEKITRAYIRALRLAGYLRVLTKEDPKKGISARYKLVSDTGPLPPEIKKRDVLIDANEERVVHVEGARL